LSLSQEIHNKSYSYTPLKGRPGRGGGDFPYRLARITAVVFVSSFFCRSYLFRGGTWLCGGFQIVTQRTCLWQWAGLDCTGLTQRHI